MCTGSAGGRAQCAGGVGDYATCAVGYYVAGVVENVRRVLLCMSEAVEDVLCLPEVLEVMLRELLCMLEAVDSVSCLLCSVMACCVLDVVQGRAARVGGAGSCLCILEAVESVRYVLELLEVIPCVVEVVDDV